jgi:very-short-patch-repair endonuclease
LKFIGLDGKEFRVELMQPKNPLRSKEDSKSKFQWETGCALRRVFPRFTILEEFNIPGTRLHIDFFIPELRIAVEADGAQHNKYSPFFHVTKEGFRRSQARDRNKEEWCKINNIRLIRVKKNEDVEGKIGESLQ